MATTFVEYTGDGNATKQFTFPSYQSSDVKVRVDGVLKTASTHYNITSYTTTGGGNVVFTSGNIPSSPAKIRIYRDTSVDAAKATYTAGSSVKAADLNNNNTQLLYRAQEEQVPNLIQAYDIDASAIETSNVKDSAVTTAKIAADAIDGTKIADDVINSEHYVDLSIDTQHIANENVTTAKLAPDAVTGSKLADNAVDSEHFVDGSIDHVHLANDVIDGDNIQDDVINSEHYVAGSIDHEHLANDVIDGDNIQDDVINSEHYVAGSIDREHLAADIVDDTKIADNAIGSEHIQTNAVTDAEIATGTLDNRYFTETESDARYFRQDSSETISSGNSWTSSDAFVATTGAIDARIIDLVDDVGGFVPIANETSFPTANPDVNNGAGTLVSIKEISSTRTPSTGTVTIANGSGSNTVTITGCGSTVLTAGFGVIVETTTTLHTYAFHRLVPKATEVTTVSGISSNVTTVAGIASDVTAVAADASDIGVVAADGTDIGLVAGSISNVNTTAGSIANVNTVAGSISNVNSVGSNISNVNAVNSNESNINSAVSNASNINSAVSNATNINTVAGAITNVNNVGGSIANVNTVASNLSSVNNFADQYRIGSSNPTTSLDTGDLFFNTTSSSLKVYTGSAWVDGVTTTGDFALKTGNTFTGSNIHNDDVKSLYGTGSDLEVFHNGTNSFIDNNTGDLHIQTTGSGDDILLESADDVTIKVNASQTGIKATGGGAVDLYYDNNKKFETTSTGVSVTGNITVSGNVDGRDVAADGTKLDGIATGAIANVLEDTSPQLGGLLDANGSNIKFADSSGATVNRAVFGTGDDLQIYHTGTNSIIAETGTGNLELQTDGSILLQKGNSEFLAKFISDGACELYHDNVKKIETQSTGIHVTGDVSITGHYLADDNERLKMGDGFDLQIYHDGTHSRLNNVTGTLVLQSDAISLTNNAGNSNRITTHSSGEVKLYHSDSLKLETTSGGVTVTGDLTVGTAQILSNGNILIADNDKIKIGTGEDLQIYHDGTYNRIESGATTLFIRSNLIELADNSGNKYIKCVDGGTTELYHNANKKLETTSGGVEVTGNFAMSGGFNGNLVPDSDSSRNLGANGTRWANAYVDTYYGDGSNLTGIASFPSGTKMIFQQTSAPTGWTKVTSSVNNKALRVVSGSVGSGGSNAFTDTFTASIGVTANAGNTTATGNVSVANASTGGTVNSHTLSTSEMPSHSHTFNDHLVDSNRGMTATHNAYTFNNSLNASRSTDNTGGGGGHSHGFTGGSHNHNATFSGSAHNHSISVTNLDMAVQYLDVIIAAKD